MSDKSPQEVVEIVVKPSVAITVATSLSAGFASQPGVTVDQVIECFQRVYEHMVKADKVKPTKTVNSKATKSMEERRKAVRDR